MRSAIRILTVLCIALSSGCSKPGEKFLGTWTNEWTNGKLAITIERINDDFLVRTTVIDTGRAIETSTARFDNGYLVLNEGKLFRKIGLVEREGALLPLDSPVPLPAFRRLEEKAPTLMSRKVDPGIDQTAIDAAAGITAYFQENGTKTCNAKAQAYCAHSMEAVPGGFRLHAKANRPIGELTFDVRSTETACFLLRAAKAKLPTELILEARDDHGEIVRYARTCKAE